MKCDDTCKECDFTGGCTKCHEGYSKAQSNGKYICVLIDGTSTGMVVFIVLTCVVCIPLIICCVCFVFCCREGGSSGGNLAGSNIFSNNNPNPFFGMDNQAENGYISNFYGGVNTNTKQTPPQPSQEISFEAPNNDLHNYDIPHSRPSPNLSVDTFPVPYFPPPSGFAKRRNFVQETSDHSNPANATSYKQMAEQDGKLRPAHPASIQHPDPKGKRSTKPDKPRNNLQDLKLDSFY